MPARQRGVAQEWDMLHWRAPCSGEHENVRWLRIAQPASVFQWWGAYLSLGPMPLCGLACSIASIAIGVEAVAGRCSGSFRQLGCHLAGAQTVGGRCQSMGAAWATWDGSWATWEALGPIVQVTPPW